LYEKIAFISDIHSNLEALNAVLEDIEKRNIDEVYCVGDLVGYGPNPNEVVEIIRERKIPTVMGNYDDAIGYEKTAAVVLTIPAEKQKLGMNRLVGR